MRTMPGRAAAVAGAFLLVATVSACTGTSGPSTRVSPAAATTPAATTSPPASAPATGSAPPVTAPSGTATSGTATPSGSTGTTTPPPDVTPTILRPGAHGAAVADLQQQLIDLGYWLPAADGRYGPLTSQAVLALQKAAGLSRDGVFGPRTRAALERGVRPRARSTSGHVVEVDKKHQLLMLVDNGRVSLVLNTSTGSGLHFTHPDGRDDIAVTPSGRFRVTRQVDGWRKSDLGMLWRPKYFNGGIAVHGFTSVPAFPASHGCVRVSISAMNMLWDGDLIPIGTAVWVY